MVSSGVAFGKISILFLVICSLGETSSLSSPCKHPNYGYPFFVEASRLGAKNEIRAVLTCAAILVLISNESSYVIHLNQRTLLSSARVVSVLIPQTNLGLFRLIQSNGAQRFSGCPTPRSGSFRFGCGERVF